MALKKRLSEEERFGLTHEETVMAEKYLRKYKTAGAVPDTEALKLYEMYMLGCSFNDIVAQYPQYQVERVILTCALRRWAHDRERMLGSLRDRVQAKVVKSVIEQVDLLTTMLSVTNTEHLEEMRKYIVDPKKHPKPQLRIKSLKDYKEAVETLSKIVAGTTPGSSTKSGPMFNALTSSKSSKPLLANSESEKETDDAATIIAGAIEGG